MFFMKNKEYRDFLLLGTREDVAKFLGGSLKNLSFLLYILPKEKQYHDFSIPKKNGGKRQISSPISSIKRYQRELADILSEYYHVKSTVHGYVKGKNIKTNAIMHCNKRWIVNIDLKDFFSSIHFGRVLGVFKSKPFEFNDKVATLLAQICCFDGKLPQGAPTSPIISNYVCRNLDNNLLNYAKKNKLTYSRYADDITFSTNMSSLPENLGKISEDHELRLSDELLEIITNNNFAVNSTKVHYANRNNRQEVTGLIVNKKVNIKRTYIRRIRAMLHAWQKFGLSNAAIEHFNKYSIKTQIPDFPDLAFKKRITGQIGFIGHIKGSNDNIYRNLYKRIKELDPMTKLTLPNIISSPESCNAIILCEGKTDSIHLQTALKYFIERGEFVNLKIHFYKYPDEAKINNSYLYKLCEARDLILHNVRIVCLFDCDDAKYVKHCCEGKKLYKNWGNNLYSCLLPQPMHRDFKEICIEHFYTDDILLTTNNKGRRIYLSNEFVYETGFHKTENIQIRKRDDAKSPYPKIIDSGVFKSNGENIAMSKNDFANSIAAGEKPFDNISFETFRPIFDLISDIVNE